MSNMPIFMNIIDAYQSLLFWMAKIHSDKIMKIAILIIFKGGSWNRFTELLFQTWISQNILTMYARSSCNIMQHYSKEGGPF